jgi:hypothetical protein
VGHPKNESGVGSPTINPKHKRRAPQQQSPNDKIQCKYKNNIWIRSKKTEQQAMVITNNSKRTISKPGLFQGCTRRCKMQRNSVKSPMRVKQPSLKSNSCKAGTAKNQMGTEISTTNISPKTRWRPQPKQNDSKIKTTKYNRKIHKNTEQIYTKIQQKNKKLVVSAMKVEERPKGWIVQGRRMQEEATARSVGYTRRRVRSTLRRVELTFRRVQCRRWSAR